MIDTDPTPAPVVSCREILEAHCCVRAFSEASLPSALKTNAETLEGLVSTLFSPRSISTG
jgi:hypothetical protein